MAHPTDEQIPNYARQLWERAGQPEGSADDFRHQAEIELNAESENPDPMTEPIPKVLPG